MNKKVDFDEFAIEYDNILEGGTSFFTKDTDFFARYKVELLGGMGLNQPKKILEFGCGTGRNIKHLAVKFPDATIYGSDISDKSLEIAKKFNSSVTFLNEKTDLILEKFDLIFVAGVFHHIEPQQRTQTLRLLESRLEAAGQLVIFEHNPYNPLTKYIVNNCIYDEDAVLLSASEIKRLAGETNLTVIKSGYCLFIPPFFKKVIWLESLFKKIPFGGQHWTCLIKR